MRSDFGIPQGDGRKPGRLYSRAKITCDRCGEPCFPGFPHKACVEAGIRDFELFLARQREADAARRRESGTPDP